MWGLIVIALIVLIFLYMLNNALSKEWGKSYNKIPKYDQKDDQDDQDDQNKLDKKETQYDTAREFPPKTNKLNFTL